VAISVQNDEQWAALCDVVGDAELRDLAHADPAGRLEHAQRIDARIGAWSIARTPLEATAALQAAGVPAGPSSSAGDLLEQPQLRARGFFVAPEHPETGARDIPSLPWRFGRERPCSPAPLVGEHNEEVLREMLGRRQEDIERLNARRDAALRARSGALG
jgi:crotonobetainyl-CoA:carnitine CoA-transferase CaiB-like acyl-CoA transferase